MSAVVVIPAHNEAAVIGRCLDRLAAGGFREDELTVVVTANGCTDATAEIARAHPLRPVVIDRPEPGKPAALNAADAAVPGSPRVYLDADIELGARALRDLLAALSGDPSVLAAAPSPRFRTDGCSVLVKAYYSIWRQMPVLADSYVGSGVFGLSAAGHARVAPFPEVIAEDEYVRRSFSSAERRTTPGHFDIRVARTIRAHVTRGTRTRAGNEALARGGSPPAPSGGGGRGLVLRLARDPRRIPALVVFVAVTATIRLRARWRRPDAGWERDETSRQVNGRNH